MDKTYILTEELRTALINFLQKKPFEQVMPLIKTLTEKQEFTTEDLNIIVNYLANTQIYIEVFRLISVLQDEVSKQDK